MSESSSRDGDATLRHQLFQQKRHLLWRVQKMTFWVVYDFAGPLILLNLATLALVLGTGWLAAWAVGPGLSLVVVVLLVTVAMTGQARLISGLLSGETYSYRCVPHAMILYGGRAILLVALFMVGLLVAGVGVWFYATRVMPAYPAVGYLLVGVCMSAGVAVAMPMVYLLPALVVQRGSALRTARTSVVLAARHPVLTPGLLVVGSAFGVVLSTPPGFLLFSTIPLVALGCSAYELLARQYAVEAALADGTWPEVPANINVLDEDDIFLNRGFSDFLFPWKA